MAKELKRARERDRLQVSFEGVKSRTLQAFRDECDVNQIMAKFERTALLDHVREYEGRYGDFTDCPQDFHMAMNQVRRTMAMFGTLPAKVRKQFNNDPGMFVEFVSGADEAQLREAGLIPPGDTAEPEPSGSPQGAVGEPVTAPQASEASE